MPPLFRPSAICAACSAQVICRLRLVPGRIWHAEPAQRDDLAFDVRRVQPIAVEPWVARHDRSRRRRARLVHVDEVPGVRILAADTMQVGAGALRAPEEGMVVDELAGLRVLAVALGLGADRPNHLRVAADAALTDVEVAPLDLERRIRLHRGDRRDIRPDQGRRHELDDAADDDRDEASGRRTGPAATRATRCQVPLDARLRPAPAAAPRPPRWR